MVHAVCCKYASQLMIFNIGMDELNVIQKELCSIFELLEDKKDVIITNLRVYFFIL